MNQGSIAYTHVQRSNNWCSRQHHKAEQCGGGKIIGKQGQAVAAQVADGRGVDLAAEQHRRHPYQGRLPRNELRGGVVTGNIARRRQVGEEGGLEADQGAE